MRINLLNNRLNSGYSINPREKYMRDVNWTVVVIGVCFVLVGLLGIFFGPVGDGNISVDASPGPGPFTVSSNCEINCTEVLDSNYQRISVPGGWIYTRGEFSTFLVDCEAPHIRNYPGECIR